MIGAALGGSISFIVSRQQIKSAWMQREADAAQEQNRRSEDRRFAAYSEFITRARSCRNAVGAYYLHSDNRPSIKELDALLQGARDSSTLGFLVVESEEAYEGCRAVVRSLGVVQAVLRGLRSSSTDNPWNELNPVIGRSTRADTHAETSAEASTQRDAGRRRPRPSALTDTEREAIHAAVDALPPMTDEQIDAIAAAPPGR